MKYRLILWTLIIEIFFAVPALAVQFNHEEHQIFFIEEPACFHCHKDDAEQIFPAKQACLECHDEEFYKTITFPGIKTHGPIWALNHRAPAKSGTIDCSVCHEQSYCLECHKAGFADEMSELGNNMVNVHRSEFHVTHPIAARTDPQLCSSCHERRFCVDCHARFAPEDLAILSHRKAWSLREVVGTPHETFTTDRCQQCHPDSVLPTHEWYPNHAREARKNLATCQACHPEGEICLTCHSARTGLRVNPHPRDWNDMKDRLRDASDNRTCRKCH
jgi:hypothetical protein